MEPVLAAGRSSVAVPGEWWLLLASLSEISLPCRIGLSGGPCAFESLLASDCFHWG